MEIIGIKKATEKLKLNAKKIIFGLVLGTTTLTTAACGAKTNDYETRQEYNDKYNLSEQDWVTKYKDDVLGLEIDGELKSISFIDALEMLDEAMINIECGTKAEKKQAEEFITNNSALVDSIRNRFLFETIMLPIDENAKYDSKTKLEVRRAERYVGTEPRYNEVNIVNNGISVFGRIDVTETHYDQLDRLTYNYEYNGKLINLLKSVYECIKSINTSGIYSTCEECQPNYYSGEYSAGKTHFDTIEESVTYNHYELTHQKKSITK
jgi:hypothetical protein